jgi:sporulation protein YlmC with PRC-barrel domain
MSPEPVRASALLRQTVYDGAGNRLGRVADLETVRDGEGRERLVAVLVSDGPWGRLLGYEREEVEGPWLLEVTARRILRRHLRRIPWTEANLDLPLTSP